MGIIQADFESNENHAFLFFHSHTSVSFLSGISVEVYLSLCLPVPSVPSFDVLPSLRWLVLWVIWLSLRLQGC